MKKIILAFCIVMTLCFCLAACKTNENTTSENNTVPDTQSNVVSGVQPGNGQVTDGNGIIGDTDDLVYPRESSGENMIENAGDTVQNAADNVGNTASNITSNAGNIVSNITSNVGDSVSNIAHNAGDTVDHATDNNESTNNNDR